MVYFKEYELLKNQLEQLLQMKFRNYSEQVIELPSLSEELHYNEIQNINPRNLKSPFAPEIYDVPTSSIHAAPSTTPAVNNVDARTGEQILYDAFSRRKPRKLWTIKEINTFEKVYNDLLCKFFSALVF